LEREKLHSRSLEFPQYQKTIQGITFTVASILRFCANHSIPTDADVMLGCYRIEIGIGHGAMNHLLKTSLPFLGVNHGGRSVYTIMQRVDQTKDWGTAPGIANAPACDGMTHIPSPLNSTLGILCNARSGYCGSPHMRTIAPTPRSGISTTLGIAFTARCTRLTGGGSSRFVLFHAANSMLTVL
jgi:hypothetical protein